MNPACSGLFAANIDGVINISTQTAADCQTKRQFRRRPPPPAKLGLSLQASAGLASRGTWCRPGRHEAVADAGIPLHRLVFGGPSSLFTHAQRCGGPRHFYQPWPASRQPPRLCHGTRLWQARRDPRYLPVPLPHPFRAWVGVRGVTTLLCLSRSHQQRATSHRPLPRAASKRWALGLHWARLSPTKCPITRPRPPRSLSW